MSIKLMFIVMSLLVHVSVAMTAEEFNEEQLAFRDRHQSLLNAARSGDVGMLNDFLAPAEESSSKHTPTAYDVRELFNAAFINKQWGVMQCLWSVPGLPDPVDYSYLGMDIDYPQTTVPYARLKGFDDLNDIFSYNICSRTAFCHIYTIAPNRDPENSRWIPIFAFLKVAEEAGQEKLIRFILEKAYLYNHRKDSKELEKWVSFMREKAASENCLAVENVLTAESLSAFIV